MAKTTGCVALVLALSAFGYTQGSGTPQTGTMPARKAAKDPDKFTDLHTAIALAKAAITDAQAQIAQQNTAGAPKVQRPSLSAAEFDFQTVVTERRNW
jgi:hypothetical protein